jgi:hypothetical protein
MGVLQKLLPAHNIVVYAPARRLRWSNARTKGEAALHGRIFWKGVPDAETMPKFGRGKGLVG